MRALALFAISLLAAPSVMASPDAAPACVYEAEYNMAETAALATYQWQFNCNQPWGDYGVLMSDAVSDSPCYEVELIDDQRLAVRIWTLSASSEVHRNCVSTHGSILVYSG